jgi:hypothetical protein
VLLLTTGAAAETGPAAKLECLGRVRRDMGQCMQKARDACRRDFETHLPGCFPGSPCPTDCLQAEERCRTEPLTDRDGCRLACQADQKVGLRGCKIAEDPSDCRRTVRVKGSKCKSHCARMFDPALQTCKATFDDCIRGCAAGSSTAGSSTE